MAIEYRKSAATPVSPNPVSPNPVSLSKVTLTKATPTVSLTKQGATTGMLRVNLNWNPGGGGGRFRRSPAIDLDLGCLYDARNGARICGVAMLESNGTDLSVRREVNYVNGGQSALDRAYGWGLSWTPGRK